MRKSILFLPVLLFPVLTRALFLQPPSLPIPLLPSLPSLIPVRNVWKLLSSGSKTAFQHRLLNQWDTSLDELRRCVDIRTPGDCVVAPLRGTMAAALLLGERFVRVPIPSSLGVTRALEALPWARKKKQQQRKMLSWR